MVLVISLPCCLLLPNGDYQVKLDKDDTVNLNLTKVIPNIYDERLPYRGFREGELANISKLRIMFTNEVRDVDTEELPKIKESGIVIKYFDKTGQEIIPELVKNDVNLQESDILRDSMIRTLSQNDSIPEDEIDRLMREQYHGRQILFNGEIKKDSFGRFRYTKVRYSSTKVLNMDREFERAVKAINILIDVYRIETQEHWITNITEDEIFIYKSVSEDNGQMAYSMKGFTQKKEDHNAETISGIKKKLLNRDVESPYFMLIMDAMKALDDGKYYLAVIYAITALESIVKTYIIIYSKRRTFSDRVIDNLLSLGLQFQLSTILKIFVVSKKFEDNLIDKAREGIRIRNKIIHQSDFNVNKEKAKEIIQNIKEIVAILIYDLNKE